MNPLPMHNSNLNSVKVEGRPDIIIKLDQPGALESLKSKPFTIKGGAQFRMKVEFKVQHQILSGLKYVQVAKRMGVSNKMQEMIVRLTMTMMTWFGLLRMDIDCGLRGLTAPIQRTSRSMRRNVS